MGLGTLVKVLIPSTSQGVVRMPKYVVCKNLLSTNMQVRRKAKSQLRALERADPKRYDCKPATLAGGNKATSREPCSKDILWLASLARELQGGVQQRCGKVRKKTIRIRKTDRIRRSAAGEGLIVIYDVWISRHRGIYSWIRVSHKTLT